LPTEAPILQGEGWEGSVDKINVPPMHIGGFLYFYEKTIMNG